MASQIIAQPAQFNQVQPGPTAAGNHSSLAPWKTYPLTGNVPLTGPLNNPADLTACLAAQASYLAGRRALVMDDLLTDAGQDLTAELLTAEIHALTDALASLLSYLPDRPQLQARVLSGLEPGPLDLVAAADPPLISRPLRRFLHTGHALRNTITTLEIQPGHQNVERQSLL